MKNRLVLLFLLVGFISAFILLASHPSQPVFAQDICGYDNNKTPIPCPKRRTPKPVPPTRTPIPTATNTPAPPPAAVNSTTAGALLLISQGSVAGCQNNLDTGPNGGGSPISPILLGGGGLLAGILIGLLLPAVQRGLTGGGGARGGIVTPSDDAGIVTPSDNKAGFDVFKKRGGAGITDGTSISGNNTFDNTGGPSNNSTQDKWVKAQDKWAKADDSKADYSKDQGNLQAKVQDDWAKAQDMKGQADLQAKVQDDWADKWAKNSGPQENEVNGDG